MTSTIVSLRGVGVRYGKVRVLDGVDLTVGSGERVALIGPSGAGKSTLLGVCTGSVLPRTGDTLVLGQELRNASPKQLAAVRRRVGMVHQELDLVDQLRVVHNVNAGRLGHWGSWRALRSLVRPVEVQQARDALARLGVADKLMARADELSGGERQRVALARVLVQDPDLILGDEPVSSLDPARAEEVLRLLCEVVAGRDRALVVSLHNFDLALRHCDRVVGLREGHVVFDRATRDVDGDEHRQLYELEAASWPQPM